MITISRFYSREDYAFSLEDIGAELGLGPERVRQIQNVALMKLREGLLVRGFTLIDLIPDCDRPDCRIEPPESSGVDYRDFKGL